MFLLSNPVLSIFFKTSNFKCKSKVFFLGKNDLHFIVIPMDFIALTLKSQLKCLKNENGRLLGYL